jgi:tryptophan-rich sensory protein
MAVQMNKLDTYPISTNWITIPYCLWLGYATYLNAGIIFNNRTDKRV